MLWRGLAIFIVFSFEANAAQHGLEVLFFPTAETQRAIRVLRSKAQEKEQAHHGAIRKLKAQLEDSMLALTATPNEAAAVETQREAWRHQILIEERHIAEIRARALESLGVSPSLIKRLKGEAEQLQPVRRLAKMREELAHEGEVHDFIKNTYSDTDYPLPLSAIRASIAELTEQQADALKTLEDAFAQGEPPTNVRLEKILIHHFAALHVAEMGQHREITTHPISLSVYVITQILAAAGESLIAGAFGVSLNANLSITGFFAVLINPQFALIPARTAHERFGSKFQDSFQRHFLKPYLRMLGKAEKRTPSSLVSSLLLQTLRALTPQSNSGDQMSCLRLLESGV